MKDLRWPVSNRKGEKPMRKSGVLLASLLMLVFTLACGLSAPTGNGTAAPEDPTRSPGQSSTPEIQLAPAASDTPRPTATSTVVLPTAGPTVTGGFAGYYLAIVDPSAGQPAHLSLFDYRSNEIKVLWTLPEMPENSYFELFPSPKNDIALISACNDLNYCDLYTWGIQDQTVQQVTNRSIDISARRLQWFPDETRLFFTWPGNSVSKSSYTILHLANGTVEEKEFQFAGDAWLSPDGTKILYADQQDLLTVGLDGKNPIKILADADAEQYSWFPDGKRIWFNVYEGNEAGATMYVLDLETGERVKLAGKKGGYFFGVVISPDQKYALFRLSTPGISNDPATNNLLWIVPTDGSQEAIKIGFSAQDDFSDFASNYRFSPDGTAVLFQGSPLVRGTGKPGNYSIRPDGSDLTQLDPALSSFLLKNAFWMHTPGQ
jgi:Tol biopolymer transport system component